MSAFPRPSFTHLLPLLLYLLTRLSLPSHAPTLTPSQRALLSTTVTTRLHTLSNISETPHTINRPYLSASSTHAQNLLQSYMRAAGLVTHIDAAGNVIGDLRCPSQNRGHLLLGSHHDTVPSAGRFDGLLGVLAAISVAEVLAPSVCELPFDIRVVAFDDEEGNNAFGTTNLGSKAYSGLLNISEDITDINAFKRAYARLHPGVDALEQLESAEAPPPRAYLELHIEQGPVLEESRHSVGVVDAIAGQTRLLATFSGESGHAGTVPMGMRRDALAAAAECVLAVESAPGGMVGTVGKLSAGPGVGNVIPGSASMTVDIRGKDNTGRKDFVGRVVDACREAGGRRRVEVDVVVTHSVPAVSMTGWVVDALKDVADGGVVTSGAGHDAQIMAGVTDVGMLFVRCREGVSHTPDEFVADEDVFRGASALLDAVWRIAEHVKGE